MTTVLLCNVKKTLLISTDWIFGILEIVIFATLVFLLYKTLKKVVQTSNNLRQKALRTILALFVSFLIFIIVTLVNIVFFVFAFPGDSPPSAGYHVLNAAIKNTCFLDPQRNHCPKTVEDLINIEPEHFRELTKDAHLTYKYYPYSNQYTLIIRNNDVWQNNYRVVIFDPRLATVKNYGTGLDFFDARVSDCKGKIVIDNPPPFEGPWDKIN